MIIIELDLTGCKYLSEIHERIRVAFDFPEWYGRNWSAFWDLLWSECDADKVIVKGEYSLYSEFDKPLFSNFFSLRTPLHSNNSALENLKELFLIHTDYIN